MYSICIYVTVEKQCYKLEAGCRLLNVTLYMYVYGAQWLIGGVLDSIPRGRINPSLVLVQPRKTLPFITERLLMGR